jgi:transposase-like protein
LSIKGVRVDHATIQRWLYKFTPLIEKTSERGIIRRAIPGG